MSNVRTVIWAGYRSYLALKNDGTVFGFRLHDEETNDVTTMSLPVKVGAVFLTNVMSLASMGFSPVVLKSNGVVSSLGYQTPGMPPAEPTVTKIDESTIAIDMVGESRNTPFHYTTEDPVIVRGKSLRDVTAIAAGGGHALALKTDGTVVAWGADLSGETKAPPGLSNVTAIAAAEHLSLALKRDGTVVAWGGNFHGQTSVPAGLSNVVAIASGGWFGMALTTGSVPASVYTYPHGRIEQMEREADLIFKGQVIATAKETNNTMFPYWAKTHATRFSLVSVLKGDVRPNEVIFWHITGRPGAWSGGAQPSPHEFEQGQFYLVFAKHLGRPDYLYTLPTDATNRPLEFRQLYLDGVTRTLDSRLAVLPSVKDMHWAELNLLLNDTNPSNQIYAIEHLNQLSEPCGKSWRHTADFKRKAVLRVLFPLVTQTNDTVAIAALGCFQSGPECSTQISEYASNLIHIADTAASVARRRAAITALSGASLPSTKEAVSRWLHDPDESVREQSVPLLVYFSADFSIPTLKAMAGDPSPRVRAVVADAIGGVKLAALLPTLESLFSAPIGATNPVPPLTLVNLQAGGRLGNLNVGDVHTSAGYALLKFEPDQVADFLKTNLNDAGFRSAFLCKLAEKDAGPWLADLVDVLKLRRIRNEQKAKDSGVEPRAYYFESLMHLSGIYHKCWRIIYDHLQNLPYTRFADGKMDSCFDVMEQAGTTGSQEPTMLYELYKMKGLNKRAAKFRSEAEKKYAWASIGQLFDKIDAKYPNNGAIPDQ